MVNIISKRKQRIPLAREIVRDVEWDSEAHQTFVIIPDNLLEGILATDGWCDLELDENGNLINFIPREIPDYVKNPIPTTEQLLDAFFFGI